VPLPDLTEAHSGRSLFARMMHGLRQLAKHACYACVWLHAEMHA